MKTAKANALLATAGIAVLGTLDLAMSGTGTPDLALAFAGALPILAFGAFTLADPQ